MVDLQFLAPTSSNILVKIIVAIVVILIGIILARILSKLTYRILHELELDRILKDLGVKVPVEEFVGTIVKYIVYFIAVIIALNQLGLETIVFYIILILFLVILIVFVVLAFKDFIPNITAGFFMHQKRLIKKGDKIIVKNIEGTVMEISLIDTKIKTKGGDIVHMPNSVFLKSELKKLKKS